MSRRTRFLPPADADVLDAIRWYEDRSEGLGRRFEHEIERVLRRIAANPKMFSVVRHDVRQAIVKRFPYSIYFREVGELVVILGVFHTSRASDAWMDRIDDES